MAQVIIFQGLFKNLKIACFEHSVILFNFLKIGINAPLSNFMANIGHGYRINDCIEIELGLWWFFIDDTFQFLSPSLDTGGTVVIIIHIFKIRPTCPTGVDPSGIIAPEMVYKLG